MSADRPPQVSDERGSQIIGMFHEAVSMDRARRAVAYGALAALVTAGAGPRALASQANEDVVDVITVTADPVGVREERETNSVFGINRTLAETPRSISVVSDTTMERYSIEDIDDFITTTPGTFGGSYFGVPGALSVRGDVGDNYFRGFKRITNNGFFPLPVGASARVEIIRGPTPAIYGAGRIGGLLNFHPKTTFSENMTAEDGASGHVSYTDGRYDKNNVSAEVNLPFLLGGRESGVSIYAEYEDSKHFVRGREPEHQLVQVDAAHEFGGGFSVEFGGMYFDSEGYHQTAGWNRLTQDLIDDNIYTTGRDIDLVDLDGNGRITHNEADAGAGTWFSGQLSCLSVFTEFVEPARGGFSPFSCGAGPFLGMPGTVYDLDVGVGATTSLSPRDQLVSEFDVSGAENYILYFDIIKKFDDYDATAKLQVFYDDNAARSGTAHGFAGEHDMDALEIRGSAEFCLCDPDIIDVNVFLTASHRKYDSILRENFLSGYVVVDRVDLSVGPAGNDIFDTPFTYEPGGINTPWDSAVDSTWKDTGVAGVIDIRLRKDLGVVFNGRYDHYSYDSVDRGTITFGAPLGELVEGNEDAFSYSISGSYDLGGVLAVNGSVMPYVTYAVGNSPLMNAAGGISPGTAGGTILADSELVETGVKFELLDNSLYGAVAFFEQERSELDVSGNVLREASRGFEAELNWVINRNWAATAALTISEFDIKDPDPLNCPVGPFGFPAGQGEFVNIAPTDPSITFFGAGIPSNGGGYGGIFRVLNASCLPELADGYEKNGIPNQVASLFITYTSDETEYGTFGATFGGTYVGETGTLPVANAVDFPDYTVFRLAAFAKTGRFSVIGTVDNLFDKRYFTSLQGTFQNVTVAPGAGRTWQITGKMSF